MPSKENTESKNAPKPSPAAVVENGIVTSPEPKAMETPEEIIKKYTIASAVAGVVPVPIFDLAATSGIIMKMVADLAKAHGESFSKSRQLISLDRSSLAWDFCHLVLESLVACSKLSQVLAQW